MSELIAPGQAAVDAWRRGGDPEAAASEAEAAELACTLPPKLDEFGRDERAAARDRARARAQSRASALALLAARMAAAPAPALIDTKALLTAARGDADAYGAGAPQGEEGRRAYYSRRLRELLEVAEGVLGDVADEFASLGAVLSRLRTFKERYPDAYRRAYFSEALPALVSVFVRLQLLEWEPLFKGGGAAGQAGLRRLHFEEHRWFEELLAFSSNGTMLYIVGYLGTCIEQLDSESLA
jgi:hypothetical protein